MVYESSYESGRRPFSPDLARGNWATPTDYIFACFGLAFKLDIFTVSWFYFFQMGFSAIVPYLICLALYVVPIMVIQSFMGQFSSSGFISTFRISPLFKGIGYISLVLNFAVLTFYSIFANIPLLFFFNSLQPTLPWSCEGYKTLDWSKNLPDEARSNLCNVTVPPIKSETEDTYNDTQYENYYAYQIPSVLYFRSFFGNISFEYTEISYMDVFAMPWEMVFCNFLTWGIIAAVFYKYFNTEKLGQLLRYAVLVTLSLLLVCLVRFIFLPGATENLVKFHTPRLRELEGLPSIPMHVMAAFGAGWGSIVSLSSFNKFKTNIMRYSWIICLGQMFIFLAFGLMSYLLERHLTKIAGDQEYVWVQHHWILYLSSGSALASMGWANFWSLLFYSMLALAAWIIMVTQLYSILVSVFDEFPALRPRKFEITFGLIGVLALISMFLCSNHGFDYFAALAFDTVFTTTAINMLLLLVVLWVYGRERFQRDIEFMLGQVFSTCKVNMLRFGAPLFLFMALASAMILAGYEHMYNHVVINTAAVIFMLLPWIFIPGYAIYCMLQTTGSWKTRFQRCCRPTDWYPVDSDDRQRYEEAMGNVDITHQLNEVGDEIL